MESFRIDLGNGHRPTRAGTVVIAVAALSTFGAGISFLVWGQAVTGFDPLLGLVLCALLGGVVFGIGRWILRALELAFSAPPGPAPAERRAGS